MANLANSGVMHTVTMSMCFREAFQAKEDGKITESEYISQLTAHFQGTRHNEDDGDDSELGKLDPFGASIREMAFNPKMETLQNTMTYENLFNNCLRGDFELVKFSLDGLLKQGGAVPVPLTPLAVLAASKGHVDILRLCLNNGAKCTTDLDRAVQNQSDGVYTVVARHKLYLKYGEEYEHHKPETNADGSWSSKTLEIWFGDIRW